MVTQPITVARGGAAGKVWARRDPPPQMAVSEYRRGQIGPLLLLATDLDPDLHATSSGFGGTCRSEATSWFCSTVTLQYSLQHYCLMQLNSFMLLLTFVLWSCLGGGLQLELSHALNEAHLHTRKGKS